MKSSTSMFIWSLVWISLGVTGFIVGLAASTVNTVGAELARLLENNKKENN